MSAVVIDFRTRRPLPARQISRNPEPWVPRAGRNITVSDELRARLRNIAREQRQ